MSKRYLNNNLRPFRRALRDIHIYDFTEYERADFIAHIQKLRARLADSASLRDITAEVFALVFEAVKKTLHITPFDSQLLAALAMNDGRIIE
ncbi:MAG: hypothetical protein JW817_01965, partial [Clostridiales bacterium]|nr:hypothetical protein [Clostridiales bacterium]